jgi:DNA-binding response OmpR family regulator
MAKVQRNKTVYIIEDDADILSLLEITLRKKGYNVITDFNGNNFNAKRLPCPNLYIIDLNLIDKSGDELCREIKKECPDIPVILMSANNNLEQIAAVVKADNIMKKPLSLTRVVETVNALL